MTNYITNEGLIELRKELTQIKDVVMPEAISSINNALAEGDIKENSALDSAKLERDKLLARELEISIILNDFKIIEEHTGKPSKTVQIGGEIKVQYLFDNSIFNLKIVGSSESDAVDGKISNESPLAVAILGKKEGDKSEFKIKDRVIEIKIIEIIL
ncbi:MAG: GreA/GreB family elongation factor [candidate division SR1 bacterium]|nr:GreA/GreB family elongation factor [candidate division SR1 bacterium]